MVLVHGSCILKLSGTGMVCGPSNKGNRTETGPDFKALTTEAVLNFEIMEPVMCRCFSAQANKTQQTQVFVGSSNCSTESNTEWQQPTNYMSTGKKCEHC